MIRATYEAGHDRACDMLVRLEPGEGISINISGKPLVLKQYKRQMEAVLRNTLQEAGITDICVSAKDNGALDYVIRARLLTAIEKARLGGEAL